MTDVQIPKSATTAEKLLLAIEAAGALDADDGVPLHLPAGAFLDCSGLAALANWRAVRRAAGFVTEVGGDPNERAYLARMNVLAQLGATYDLDAPRAVERGRFVPVTEIRDNALAASNAICDLVLHYFAGGRAFVPALEWAVYEVLDNVSVHASAVLPGLVCAQFHPNRHRLEVAIVDSGRGIRASLAEAHPVSDDADAIGKALQRGVTRDPEVGQGNGLAGTRQILEVNKGYFALWSGTAKFRMSLGAMPIR
jgi:hypothetical protein